MCVQLAVLSDKNANIGILIFVALTIYYARTLDEFGCYGIAIYIAIGTAQIVDCICMQMLSSNCMST